MKFSRVGSPQMSRYLALSLALIAGSALPSAATAGAQYDHNSRYSPLKQITPANIQNLEVAWEYHTGDIPENIGPGYIAFEDQPSMIEGNLIVCSINRRISALDPATGKARWQFDPQSLGVKNSGKYMKCRGVSHWRDSDSDNTSACASRILVGTTDYQLVAIDAKTGKPCEDFGTGGIVKLDPGKELLEPDEVVAGSNPAVVNDVVVVSSSVMDNQRVDAPSGRVQAFDVRSGKFLWDWDPIPRDKSDPAYKTWSGGSADHFGQANVWSAMSVDEKLDLVYLPTTSASSDFYGGDRKGDNLYATTLVALKGSTGERVWHFQAVHHNVWDYDLPVEPMLLDYPVDGKMVPAVLQNTKMGIIFILDRATGKPLVPVEERPVPTHVKVAGEELSPTQPFSVGMPHLVAHSFAPDDAWGFTPIDRYFCRKKVEEHNYGPIYTAPSRKGTIFQPGPSGGPNWGGGGYDPESHIMVVPTSRVPMIIRLIPDGEVEVPEELSLEGTGPMTFGVKGSPYVLQVEPLLSPLGAPCSEPPWGALTAVDIVNKKILWDVPLGGLKELAPVPLPLDFGTPGAGGPLVTGGGVAFIGYSVDSTFRAFDLKTGEVIWHAALPASANSIPVSYEVNGEQYIVVPAGGHSFYSKTLSDTVIAYKLKKQP